VLMVEGKRTCKRQVRHAPKHFIGDPPKTLLFLGMLIPTFKLAPKALGSIWKKRQ